jgi:hypothetical protein
MSKIIKPASISTEFGIKESILKKHDVIDVLLNTDTLLFIDPLLLPASRHFEINTSARDAYDERFRLIIKYLNVSNEKNDVAWKAAKRLFKFSEISFTCLGYGTSTRGSGFGKELSATTLETASQIIKLGINDSELFMGLSLFEEGIGPDRISDMTTNIIINDLISFSKRVNNDLGLPTKSFEINKEQHDLVVNPYTKGPLIFVPRDIVRDLPIATDWSGISKSLKDNDNLRESVNRNIGDIWAKMTKKDREKVKKRALKSKTAFMDLLKMLREVPLTSYDFEKDRNGETFWLSLINSISETYPFDLTAYQGKTLSKEQAIKVVNQILNQFKELIEDKGLWKELWSDSDKPRKEKAAQRLFFAVASSYCKANNLDVTPEADSGNGPVDFKFSFGYDLRIVVEIKLSTNTSVVHGYETQLEVYKKAENTELGVLLLIDVGKLGRKYKDIQNLREQSVQENGIASDIVLIDGHQKSSASIR